jgi:hypothetical protein
VWASQPTGFGLGVLGQCCIDLRSVRRFNVEDLVQASLDLVRDAALLLQQVLLTAASLLVAREHIKDFRVNDHKLRGRYV